MHARTRLLPILITQREFELALGRPTVAEAARLAACEVAAYIAQHAPEELRATFLGLPSIRDLRSPGADTASQAWQDRRAN